jgi:dolichol-phosphate mannosyltransferase
MTVLVILPTYNERENLSEIVPRVLAQGARVLVVDDASPDGTGAVADELARQHAGRVEVLHRTGRRGLGRSYLDGFRRALETDADVVCQMDADLSHDPDFLPKLVEATATHDIVIGSRYVRGISVVNWPLRRLVLSAFGNGYIRAVTGLPVRDCTSGFRAWRRSAIARLPLDAIVSEGYAFIVETLFEAVRRGASVSEVPIIFVERREGESKLSQAVLWESLLLPWRLRIRGLSAK